MIFNKSGNGTSEIAAIATWTSNHQYEHIAKALILAKRKVLLIIDKTTYEIALSHYLSADYEQETPTPESTLLDQLVHHFQIIFVNFAYNKNLQKDSVIWDNSGINVAWSENFRPAQKDTLDGISSSLYKDAYEFLDILIEFLNDNSETFTDFKNSVENKRIKELFINSAEDFNYYFNINNSVSYFFEILDVIRRVQRTTIKNAIGDSFYEDIILYQINRLELLKVELEVTYFEDLQPIATAGDIALVKSEPYYYKFDGDDWLLYVYDARYILDMLKPALVDSVIQTKFVSDINNMSIKSGDKSIEFIRANVTYLEQKATASLNFIIQYIKSLQPPPVIEEGTVQTLGYSVSSNSFML